MSPNLIVGYIVPFNLVSIKKITRRLLFGAGNRLGKTIVQQAHSIGAPVFAWTPNHLSQMQLMRVYGVDGQITDRLNVLQEMNREQPSRFNWAIIQSLISQFI
ncbi:glycerophosphodiester phosphodiesterase family protein [Secundilactobacillus collinoides]|uniref:glycerophosphodiester phosphodiesterase family protein n=1 Tax=Secundilactobacillus collinoides TaxID=33960 RepID=UPI0006D00652|nr:glycerophosphodiester phosphodiesterase family protein [Secundilactobacillus collinoides]